jgi:hypothetical protein
MPDPTATSENPALDWLLKQRIESMATTFRSVWDLYIKFYTVFLTFSLGAMGWLIEHRETQSMEHNHNVIAIVFIGQSLLTCITSIGVSVYSFQTSKTMVKMEKEIVSVKSMPKSILEAKPLPVALAIWSGSANAVAMLGMMWEWYRVGIRG